MHCGHSIRHMILLYDILCIVTSLIQSPCITLLEHFGRFLWHLGHLWRPILFSMLLPRLHEMRGRCQPVCFYVQFLSRQTLCEVHAVHHTTITTMGMSDLFLIVRYCIELDEIISILCLGGFLSSKYCIHMQFHRREILQYHQYGNSLSGRETKIFSPNRNKYRGFSLILN
jgi:hypothetical protein